MADNYKQADPRLNNVYTDFDSIYENYDNDKLKKITCPVLMIQADQKNISILSDAQILEIKQKFITHASNITVSGVGHYLHIIKNDEVFNILEKFFDSKVDLL